MITISSNAEQVAVKIRNLGREASDLTPLMRLIAGELDDIKETAFERESDPVTGRAWPELKPATVFARQRRGKMGKKLQVTGRLVNSITTRVTSTTARIGTNVIYSRVHNAGFGNIPQRRFLGFSSTHVNRIKRLVEKHFAEKWRSA